MPQPACAPEPGPNDDGANAGPAEAAPAAGDAPESAKRAPKPAVITGVAIAAAALIGGGIFAATQLTPKPEAASVEQKKDDKKDDEKADKEADAKDAAEGEDEDPAAAEPATQENPLVTEARAAGLAVYTGTIRIFETDAELAGTRGAPIFFPTSAPTAARTPSSFWTTPSRPPSPAVTDAIRSPLHHRPHRFGARR